MKRVSIILCVFNGEDHILAACQSLYRMTLPRDQFEVIFVDDGSTDATEERIRSFQEHSNFRFLKNEANRGLPSACNLGLAHAEAEYVIRLDADDTFESTILEEMMPALDRGDTDLVVCDRRERLSDTGRLSVVRLQDSNIYSWVAIGTLMRRRLLVEIGGYRNLFWEEYDLYIRYLLKSGKPPVRIPRPLLTYSVRRGSMTSDPRRLEEGWQELRCSWPQEVLERFGKMPQASLSP